MKINNQKEINDENDGQISDEEDIKTERTLIKYIEGVVFKEYEKAKRCIFDKDFKKSKFSQVKDGKDKKEKMQAPFHQVFLSSLMNQ